MGLRHAHQHLLCRKHGRHARNRVTTFADRLPVKTQRPIKADDEHVVVKFRPRTSAQPPRHAAPSQRPPDQCPAGATICRATNGHRDEPDDFRHRMLANVAALAFTVALTAIGIWLAMSIADLRKTQDCVLMGRRDCARISAMPHS